jgi:ABC-type branched-subunit amino acid transport system substrate-binding protein
MRMTWRALADAVRMPMLAFWCVFGGMGRLAFAAEARPAAASELVFGMSTVLSGPAANLGKDMSQGVQAGLARANRAGGVNGHPLRLIALDDGYEPARTAPNIRQLVEKEKVLAVIGDVGTPTAIAAVPIAIELKTLFFAPFTGAGLLRKSPPDRYVINYRASYAEEIGAMVDALIDGEGLKPQDIAFFYATRWLRRRGLQRG